MRAIWMISGAVLLAVPATAAISPAIERQYSQFDQRIDDTKAAMMADPNKALKMAGDALALAQSLPDSPRARLSVATAQWLDGEAYIFLNQADRASSVIDHALAIVNRYGANTKLQGDLLRSKGAIAASSGNAKDALAAYQQAYRIFTAAHVARSQAIELQDIGQLFEVSGDYNRALYYYSQALETYDGDPALLIANYNDKAEVLVELNRRAEAEQGYKAALHEARLIGSVSLEARILANLADVQADRGELAAARSSIARASVLAHSGEASQWLPFVWGTDAKVAMAAGDFSRAGTLLDRMFAGVDLTKTDMPYLEFHQAASIVYDKLGRPGLALAHLRAYQRLNDSARDIAASTGAQLAASRFDFANQNLKISTLKAQHLSQQIQIEHQHTRLRSVIIVSVLGIVLAVFGFLSFALASGRRSRERLRRVNADLEGALKAKTEFLATTSHEIRTPLNGILGMTQVMLRDAALDPAVRERIGLVHGAGETMRVLVDDILDVAKMETGTTVLTDEDVDIAGMIGEVVGLWTGNASEKDVAMECVIEGLPPLVRLDGARLRQILFNLLSNAVKFTNEGRVALVAKAVQAKEGPMLRISVSDTGIGIAAEQQQLVFEAFHQADAGTSRRFGGTGLGLAICRNLARAMGGDIALESHVGQGSTFTLQLPIVAVQSSHQIAPEPHTLARSLNQARLLIVESNQLVQGMLRSALEPSVGAIDTVEDGEVALSAIALDHDHLLIEAGSAQMPGIGLIDSLRRLLDAAAQRNMRTSVLLATDATVSAAEIMAMGATNVLLKPLSGTALIKGLMAAYPSEETIRRAA